MAGTLKRKEYSKENMHTDVRDYWVNDGKFDMDY